MNLRGFSFTFKIIIVTAPKEGKMVFYRILSREDTNSRAQDYPIGCQARSTRKIAQDFIFQNPSVQLLHEGLS